MLPAVPASAMDLSGISHNKSAIGLRSRCALPRLYLVPLGYLDVTTIDSITPTLPLDWPDFQHATHQRRLYRHALCTHKPMHQRHNAGYDVHEQQLWLVGRFAAGRQPCNRNMGAATGSVAARARCLERDAELGVRNGEPLRR